MASLLCLLWEVLGVLVFKHWGVTVAFLTRRGGSVPMGFNKRISRQEIERFYSLGACFDFYVS